VSALPLGSAIVSSRTLGRIQVAIYLAVGIYLVLRVAGIVPSNTWERGVIVASLGIVGVVLMVMSATYSIRRKRRP
jgi:hypothetical protein